MNSLTLSFHWNTEDTEKQLKLNRATAAYQAMIKGGMHEDQARILIEHVWRDAYQEGYAEGEYDEASAHDFEDYDK